MAEIREGRTPELDQVRRLLFPRLAPEEGWARIERALARASDESRLDVIDDLAEELLDGVRPRRGSAP